MKEVILDNLMMATLGLLLLGMLCGFLKGFFIATGISARRHARELDEAYREGIVAEELRSAEAALSGAICPCGACKAKRSGNFVRRVRVRGSRKPAKKEAL